MPIDRPTRRSALLLLALVLPIVAVLVPAGGWLLVLVAPLALYPAFVPAVRERRWRRAWGLGMGWAALLSLGVILAVYAFPEAAATTIVNGEPYRLEMFGWIETGSGKETTPAAFLPEHALHLAAFVVLTWLSAGYLGLVLGALLVAYMSYFVGTYAAAAGAPVVGAIAAWVPWSVVRVAAFVLLGCLFARPLLVRRAWPFERRELRLLALAAAGIAADVTIKILLAPWYGGFLRRLAGW